MSKEKPEFADWDITLMDGNGNLAPGATIPQARWKRSKRGWYTFTDATGPVAEFTPGVIAHMRRVTHAQKGELHRYDGDRGCQIRCQCGRGVIGTTEDFARRRSRATLRTPTVTDAGRALSPDQIRQLLRECVTRRQAGRGAGRQAALRHPRRTRSGSTAGGWTRSCRHEARHIHTLVLPAESLARSAGTGERRWMMTLVRRCATAGPLSAWPGPRCSLRGSASHADSPRSTRCWLSPSRQSR